MCDTICVMPDQSENGAAMLAKNSDREPNEPHVVRFVPAKSHAEGEKVRCTYIEIPQVQHTNAVMLFKPDWIWGAEMGVNEHGVAIGNEAVFTKAKKGADALTGMDLLRLALERADCAQTALETIFHLLKEFGQGGNCGYTKDFRYDNSFLITDSCCAYILETSGKDYAAVPVSGKAAISNRLSIHKEHTIREGIKESEDFTRCFTEPVFSFFGKGKHRRAQSLGAIESSPVSAAQLIGALRTHAPGVDRHVFSRGSVGSVCMHAGGHIGDQTTGSFVAVLHKGAPMTIWATGASAPCVSAFKPVFFGCITPPVFESETEGKTYWLKREQLHRAVLAGSVDVQALRARRNTLEEAWFKEEARLFSEGVPDKEKLKSFASKTAAEEQAMIDEFTCQGWKAMHGSSRFTRYWQRKNEALI